jgi:SnoaL-like domain
MPPVSPLVDDRYAIEQLLTRFCAAVDRMDFDVLRSSFHPDAHAHFGSFVDGPIDQYFAYVASADGLPGLERTMHQLGNISFRIEGDIAYAESYVMAYHEGALDHSWCRGLVVIGARYVDRLEKRNGEWRISDRRCVYEFARNLTRGEAVDLPPESMGRRDRSDPRYAV